MLTIALSKGRLLEPTLALFERAGMSLPEELTASRKLLVPDGAGEYEFLLVKPMDLPTYVEYGVAAAGVCGRDILLELNPDLHQPLDLGFGKCRLILARSKGASASNRRNELSTTRVATKYPRLAEAYFRSRGLPVEVVYLSGSVELAPSLGLADTILDLTETGATLRENGLEIVEEISECTARLVVNRASFHLRHEEIQALLRRLREVVT